MKLAPFFANRRCQVAPPLRDEGAAFWWSKMKKISLGNVHKWTKTSRCVILNEIKVKTLGNQRFVFLENFQRSERKQTLPLPSWMFFSFIFPPFFVCFYFGHKSGYPRDVPAVTSCFSSFKDIPTGEIEWNGRRVVGHFKRKRKSKWVSKKSRHRSLSKQNSSVTSLEGGGMKKRRCWRRRHFWKIGQGEEKNWRRKCRAIFVVDVVVPFWRKNFRAISPFVTLSTWRQRRRYLLSERQHHLIKRGSYLPAPVSILLATIKRNLLWAAKNGNKRREKPATVWCILLLNRKGGNSAWRFNNGKKVVVNGEIFT